jgi:hypothetical protein
LHESLVHGFPSSVQAVPFTLFVAVHPPLPLQAELAWQVVGVQV